MHSSPLLYFLDPQLEEAAFALTTSQTCQETARDVIQTKQHLHEANHKSSYEVY